MVLGCFTRGRGDKCELCVCLLVCGGDGGGDGGAKGDYGMTE